MVPRYFVVCMKHKARVKDWERGCLQRWPSRVNINKNSLHLFSLFQSFLCLQDSAKIDECPNVIGLHKSGFSEESFCVRMVLHLLILGAQIIVHLPIIRIDSDCGQEQSGVGLPVSVPYQCLSNVGSQEDYQPEFCSCY